MKTEDPFKDYSWRRVTYWDGVKDATKIFDNKLSSLIFQAIRAPLKSAYGRGEEVIVRHRMSKEIAEELFLDMGDSAFVYVLERLENAKNPQLWRDVLTWLDDTEWVSWLTETETKGNEDERI